MLACWIPILRVMSFSARFLLLCLALLCFTSPAVADPVPPEEAFPFTVRALDSNTFEILFDLRKGYYLYDDKLGFESATEGLKLETAERPPGQTYEDEFFGKTVIHRGTLPILLPFEAPSGARAVEFVLKYQGCWDGGICYPPEKKTVTVSLDPSSPGKDFSERAQTSPSSGGDESGRIARLLADSSLALVLVSFFGFGLLLAFTPCTFPMIPILSGIIVGQGQEVSHVRAGVLSLVFVLGMAVTYALAGVAAGLSGTLLSAALQNVWVLGGFALIFVLLALSMFGFYELQLPPALQNKLSQRFSHRTGGRLGSVAVMGALSALIVGPCVAAPLAGALLYIAQSGDAALGGMALFAMALGMGAPLIAVGIGTRSLLPRSGPWMDAVKKAFGVLFLAVAIWLVSPVIPAAAVMLAWGMLLLFSGIFLNALDTLPPAASGWCRFWKGTGVMLLIVGAAIIIGLLAGSRDPLQPLAGLRGGAESVAATAPRFEIVTTPAQLDARLANTDRPVMLDFYADWCVSCKEMERRTFTDPDVAARMERLLLLQVDVTSNDENAKALLARFGLFGPPGIIFFTPEGEEIDGLRVVGFMRAQPFAEILDQALRPREPDLSPVSWRTGLR